MTQPAKDEPNTLQDSLVHLEGESMADWLRRLREDMQVRAGIGPVPRVEDYLRAFPELANHADSILELISLERLLRLEAGDDVPTEYYIARFPAQREEIEDQFAFEVLFEKQVDSWARLSDDSLGGLAPISQVPAALSTPVPPRLPVRYRFVRLLGRGGFGDVWLCRDRQVGPRPVAIKVLRPDVDDGRISARFRREASMAAQVRHSNVCVIHDSALDHDPPYLVLEYVDGETLREFLKAATQLPIDEAVRIAREIADGCHACHEQGIVHRDLKPENIKRDSKRRIKILDFGLARPYDSDQHRVTSDGRILGTIPYMSPEQTHAGEVSVEAASDQFALGVILYEMLTGERPFTVENDPKGVATLIRIEECRPKTPRRLRSEIDAALESIVLRMLQRNPRNRFGSMQEVVAVLDSYREGNRRPVPIPQRGRWARRIAISGVVLLLLAGPAGIGRIFWPTSQVSPSPKIMPFANIMTQIREDLDRQVKSGDQPFQRYFTLTNLANDPAATSRVLQRHRDALIQLVTVLSIGAPTAPIAIDAEQMVYRVDTRALGWTDEAFRRELHRHNPYALQFPSDSTAEHLRNVAHDVERRLGEVDGHYPPCARVDWFVVTFSDPPRARTLLNQTMASPEEIEERVKQITALRSQWTDLVNLYDRPVDLATACRELGVADEQAVRQAILQLPLWGDEKFGLRPLTDGKTVPRDVWAYADVPYTTFGQVCQQLKLGRRLLVR